MGDYSSHLLDIARVQLRAHDEHISALVLDAMRPSSTLGFLKYKTFFVYISNVYDNLPTDEIARIDGHLFQVESRAFLANESAEAIAPTVGATVHELSDLIHACCVLARSCWPIPSRSASRMRTRPCAFGRRCGTHWGSRNATSRYRAR